jgi:hypothetical protein
MKWLCNFSYGYNHAGEIRSGVYHKTLDCFFRRNINDTKSMPDQETSAFQGGEKKENNWL